MKSTITFEIETPDAENTQVIPEEGMTEDDYPAEELKKFREDFAQSLNDAIKQRIQSYVGDQLEEDFLDNEEELFIDGWDSFKDYGITVTTKQE